MQMFQKMEMTVIVDDEPLNVILARLIDYSQHVNFAFEVLPPFQAVTTQNQAHLYFVSIFNIHKHLLSGRLDSILNSGGDNIGRGGLSGGSGKF